MTTIRQQLSNIDSQYRITEVTNLITSEPNQIILPFDPSRILIHVYTNPSLFPLFGYRLPSGVFMPYPVTAYGNTFMLHRSTHPGIISFEMIQEQVSVYFVNALAVSFR